MFFVGGFIEGIVTCDPGIVFVVLHRDFSLGHRASQERRSQSRTCMGGRMRGGGSSTYLGELLPQPNGSILEIFMNPDYIQ